MKKCLVVFIIVPLLWQCKPSGPSREELIKAQDSLLIINAQKEIQLNKLVESLGSIDENLRLIKEKENIISLNAGNSEVKGEMKDQINDDIKVIYDLMVENKNRIQELEKQLKSSGVESGRLKKLIDGLTLQLKEKSEEIAQLNEMLLNKDVQIGELSQTVSSLAVSLDSMQTLNRQTQDELTSAQDLFHTAYYAMGTKKELRDRKITDREGFLFFGEKKVLPEGFDKQYFNTVDVRNTPAIAIAAKKAKLLTRHPDGSYNLVNGDDGNMTLNITNADEFWSITKYLVIQLN
jgi:hypothetical protein